jgi:transposase
VYNLLEDEFTLLLVNAHHVKTVPGRKTDVRDCEWLADLLRHGLLRASFVPMRVRREPALNARFDPHQRFLLRKQLERLVPIPGIGRRIAEIVVAEMGLDVSRFPTAAHLAAWAGLALGNNQSAGKRLTGRLRQGSPALRMALVEAAYAAAHTKNTYLAAQHRRLAARRGAKRAAVAVAQTILGIIYYLRHEGTVYRDLWGHLTR